MPYGSTLHVPPTNLLLLAAKQEPYKKAYLLMKNIEEFSGKSLERASRQRKISFTFQIISIIQTVIFTLFQNYQNILTRFYDFLVDIIS